MLLSLCNVFLFLSHFLLLPPPLSHSWLDLAWFICCFSLSCFYCFLFRISLPFCAFGCFLIFRYRIGEIFISRKVSKENLLCVWQQLFFLISTLLYQFLLSCSFHFLSISKYHFPQARAHTTCLFFYFALLSHGSSFQFGCAFYIELPKNVMTVIDVDNASKFWMATAVAVTGTKYRKIIVPLQVDKMFLFARWEIRVLILHCQC